MGGENGAELEATHKWLELEKEACSTTAKLPKLLITPLKGTPTNWVRFGNMFVTQVQNKSIRTEGTTFHWVVHGRKDYTDRQHIYVYQGGKRL